MNYVTRHRGTHEALTSATVYEVGERERSISEAEEARDGCCPRYRAAFPCAAGWGRASPSSGRAPFRPREYSFADRGSFSPRAALPRDRGFAREDQQPRPDDEIARTRRDPPFAAPDDDAVTERHQAPLA